MPSNHLTTINALCAELEAAVRDGDHSLAQDLGQTILQRLAAEAADRTRVKRKVRALMAKLETPKPRSKILIDRPPAKPIDSTDWNGDFAKLDTDEASSSTQRLNLELLSTEKGDFPILSDGVVYPVWFGTNRKPDNRGGFGNERHKGTTQGRVLVHVPEAHRFGETGTSFWKKLLRFDLRNDRLRIQQVERSERGTFFSEIHEAMRAASETGNQPHALFFLHGYNNSFEDAAIRAAQIGYDLKVPGATAFFSWPSRGTVQAYPVDEATIEASERAITDFLVDFAANCGAEKVHIIAHSMGNRGLLRALQRITANAATRGNVKFDQIFLAAPDVDRDLFMELVDVYPDHSVRTTLYASNGDLPVHLSAKFHDAPRAGYYTPYTVVPGVDTVAVPNFDIDLLGHAYFAQAEALLHDIYDLMRHNEPPSKRQRLTPAYHDGASFWKIGR